MLEQESALAANGITEAFLKAMRAKDAAGIAALYTEDAIRLTPGGPQNGRAEIQNFWAEGVKGWEPEFFKVDRAVPIGGDVLLAVTRWPGTYHSPNVPVAY